MLQFQNARSSLQVLRILREVGTATCAELAERIHVQLPPGFPISAAISQERLITALLEQLKDTGLVELRAGPEGDLSAVLRADRLEAVQVTTNFSLSRQERLLEALEAPLPDRVLDVAKRCDAGYTIDPLLRPDLVQSLREIAECLRSDCLIAVLCLCGKVVEIALLGLMARHGISAGDTAGLGRMLWCLRKIDKHNEQTDDKVHIDAGLQAVGQVINASRIPAVHAKREVPIPSQDQANMVVFATLDLVERAWLAGS